jgi:hypothetical protein
MKECSACGRRKDEAEFYVNKATSDGLTYRCRVCMSDYQKARREALNASKPDGWKKKTEDMAAYMKAWKEANPGYMTKAKRDWWNRNKDRQRVKDAVKYALKTGKLVKTACQVCGKVEVEGHHPDYSRPLDVVWLCKEHHMEIHKAV